jgi:hypothetical protein
MTTARRCICASDFREAIDAMRCLVFDAYYITSSMDGWMDRFIFFSFFFVYIRSRKSLNFI